MHGSVSDGIEGVSMTDGVQSRGKRYLKRTHAQSGLLLQDPRLAITNRFMEQWIGDMVRDECNSSSPYI